MSSYLACYILTCSLKAELALVDARLVQVGVSNMKGIMNLKNALIALANMVDFELTVRNIYEEHRTLSASFKRCWKNYEFAKYLRNKLVGHVLPELVEKAIEWKPELRYMAAPYGG